MKDDHYEDWSDWGYLDEDEYIRIVFVAGYYDPIHAGHITNLKMASRLGDIVIALIHRDECCERKKGYCFMPLWSRKTVLESIYYVDEVMVCPDDCDGTVVKALHMIREQYPDAEIIFAKGGDRTPENMPKEELEACAELNIKIVYGLGNEPIHSSDLVNRVCKTLDKKT